ncbi:MAG: D-alanine--D-alanine ligase [Alphaproteobacteria bacterium]|nr:D-alanine--D-alanine ligase [Alphaproteobacteria bacterium]
MAKHVAVLMGGWSSEREVSLASGKGVAEALTRLGYKVTPVDVGHDVAAVLAKLKPDVAFNALHGRFGEDGCIQGVLEVLEIPYTHSGVMASAVAMDKQMSKLVFAEDGLPLAEGKVVTKQEAITGEVLPRPYVIKPVNEGSSVGVHIVFNDSNFHLNEKNWPFGDKVMVERYIPGREIQVAVCGEGKDAKALGAIEIRPKGLFYDYEAKYTEGKADHLMPAPLSKADYALVLEYAERAHRALGCRGVSRTDFRYDDTAGDGTGKFYVLEINNQPGMTPLSLAPEIAAHAGIGYDALVERLVREARCGN